MLNFFTTRKITIPILFIVLSVFIAFAQRQKLILTDAQNVIWLDSLKKLPLDKQLVMLKERLLADTNVYVSEHYGDRILIREPIGNRVRGEGKPLMIAVFVKNRTSPFVDTLPVVNTKDYFIMPTRTIESKKIINLTRFITPDNISQVKVNKATISILALYGSSASNGLIMLVLRDKKYLQRFKEINLQNE